MKILLDCERMKYSNTGIYHYCLHLGNSLAKQLSGSQKDTLSFYIKKELTGIFGPQFKYLHQQSLHKFFKPSFPDTDIWHVTYQHSDYFSMRGNHKTVLTVHDINFMHDSNKPESRKKKYLQKLSRVINDADGLIFISEFVQNDVKKYIPLDNKLTRVIHNGCNIDSTIKSTEPFGFPQTPFIYTIGTIASKKNFHVLPSLLVGNDLTLVISGIVQEPAYLAAIKEAAAHYHVENRVVFTGPVTEGEKYWYLQHCESFVFPSLMEGFGLPVIEAMYFGKPVFLSMLTALPEIGGSLAYYFDSFDDAAMRNTYQKGMEQFTKDKTAIEIKLKQRAASFDWEETAKKCLDFYQEVLTKKS
jgi:glycosyltransferase involved in cell wall biosynthesis